MFGVSFLEIALVALVALVVVGPQKLPGMMRTAGEWVGKIRRLTADMRAQTGIDDILREEGIDGVAELRTLLKGERAMAARRSAPIQRGYEAYDADPDPAVEFPVEGPDAQGALPDDLLEEDSPPPEVSHTPSESAQSASPATAPASPPSEKKNPPTTPSTQQAAPSRPPPPSRRPSPPKSNPSSRSEPPRPPSKPISTPGAIPSSIPPAPVTPRHSPPRAVTHRETPVSKTPQPPAAPKVTISTPPTPSSNTKTSKEESES